MARPSVYKHESFMIKVSNILILINKMAVLPEVVCSTPGAAL